MNAADVLAGIDGAHAKTAARLVAALLAHGEQGVAILPDGTLWALEPVANPQDWDTYRLVPVSAEAGDTDHA